MRSAGHETAYYAISFCPCYHLALRPQYHLQHQDVTHPQPKFVPQYEFCICLCWNFIFTRLVSFIILLVVEAFLRRDLDYTRCFRYK
jgi:hypothetical protein